MLSPRRLSEAVLAGKPVLQKETLPWLIRPPVAPGGLRPAGKQVRLEQRRVTPADAITGAQVSHSRKAIIMLKNVLLALTAVTLPAAMGSVAAQAQGKTTHGKKAALTCPVMKKPVGDPAKAPKLMVNIRRCLLLPRLRSGGQEGPGRA